MADNTTPTADPPAAFVVRPYADGDHRAVRDLFIRVNRALAPPHLATAFASYVATSLAEEIDRIPAYYAEHGGSFFVAYEGDALIGMFGLERDGRNAMELRRMYVAPEVRRRGIGRRLLAHAEMACREAGLRRLTLSTSELQPEALALYRASGFTLRREAIAEAQSNRTIGGGIRRFHFEKRLA
jgi:putative acetyltransferase